jgi:hypothetical protein
VYFTKYSVKHKKSNTPAALESDIVWKDVRTWQEMTSLKSKEMQQSWENFEKWTRPDSKLLFIQHM